MSENKITITSRGVPHEKPRRYRYYIGRRRLLKAIKKAWEGRKLTPRELWAIRMFGQNHPEHVVQTNVWVWQGAAALPHGADAIVDGQMIELKTAFVFAPEGVHATTGG